jgi:hypothetical protein
MQLMSTAMLSPAAKLYFWAKRDRFREPTFFRTRMQTWRQVMRVEQDADYTPRFRFRGMKSAGKTSRPTWTPWLWVK